MASPGRSDRDTWLELLLPLRIRESRAMEHAQSAPSTRRGRARREHGHYHRTAERAELARDLAWRVGPRRRRSAHGACEGGWHQVRVRPG